MKYVINLEYFIKNDVIIVNVQKFLRDDWENVLLDDIFKIVIVDEVYYYFVRIWC